MTALVLRRILELRAELYCSVPAPARIEQHGARERNEIGVACFENRFRVAWIADEADRAGDDTGFAADLRGERHLVARSDRHFCIGYGPAAGDRDVIAAERLQGARVYDGIGRPPRPCDEIAAGNLGAERATGPRRAQCREDFERE